MTYNCPQCGLPRTGNQAVGLAMLQCLCSWQFTPPTPPAPQREWQGLTENEGKAIVEWQLAGHRPIKEVINEIEAKLKEKNGG